MPPSTLPPAKEKLLAECVNLGSAPSWFQPLPVPHAVGRFFWESALSVSRSFHMGAFEPPVRAPTGDEVLLTGNPCCMQLLID